MIHTKLLRGLCTSLLVLTLIIAPAPQARAITVFDPTNLAQNLLQATRALEQINNQIRQIE
jgi:type IV secretion system protein TrbJ